jgi:hypothetical protein
VLVTCPFDIEAERGLGDKPLNWSPLGADFYYARIPPLEGFYKALLRGGLSSTDLVSTRKEDVEL